MGLSPVIHQHRIEVAQDIGRRLREQKSAAHDEFCCNKGAMGMLRQALTALDVKAEEMQQKADAEWESLDLEDDETRGPVEIDHAALVSSIRQTLLALVEAAAANIVSCQGREAQADESIKICQEVYDTEREVLRKMMDSLGVPESETASPTIATDGDA